MCHLRPTYLIRRTHHTTGHYPAVVDALDAEPATVQSPAPLAQANSTWRLGLVERQGGIILTHRCCQLLAFVPVGREHIAPFDTEAPRPRNKA